LGCSCAWVPRTLSRHLIALSHPAAPTAAARSWASVIAHCGLRLAHLMLARVLSWLALLAGRCPRSTRPAPGRHPQVVAGESVGSGARSAVSRGVRHGVLSVLLTSACAVLALKAAIAEYCSSSTPTPSTSSTRAVRALPGAEVHLYPGPRGPRRWPVRSRGASTLSCSLSRLPHPPRVSPKGARRRGLTQCRGRPPLLVTAV